MRLIRRLSHSRCGHSFGRRIPRNQGEPMDGDGMVETLIMGEV